MFESADTGQYVPANTGGKVHPFQGPFIMWGTSGDGTQYAYQDLYDDNELEIETISGDIPPATHLQPVGYSPLNKRCYFMPYDLELTANLDTYYFDVVTGNFVRVVNTNLVGYKYTGGSYDPVNDRIYLIPSTTVSNPTVWHYIDCATGLLTSYTGPDMTVPGPASGYNGGSLDPINRRIIMSPNGADSTLHYIDLDTGTVVSYSVGLLDAFPFESIGAPCFSAVTGRMYMPVATSQGDYSYYLDCNVPTPALTLFDIEQDGRDRLPIYGQMTYIPHTGMMIDGVVNTNNELRFIRESGVGESPASITSNPQYN
jgi:hypothetical protein